MTCALHPIHKSFIPSRSNSGFDPQTMNLTIRQLQEILKGELAFGSMPPLDGSLQEIRRLVAVGEEVHEGDVVAIGGTLGREPEGIAEYAFMQGALGVIASRDVTPWDGGFTIRVPCVRSALTELARWHRQRFSGLLVAIVDDQDATSLVDELNLRCKGQAASCDAACNGQDILWQLLQFDLESPVEFVHFHLPNCCERSIRVAAPDIVVVSEPSAVNLDDLAGADAVIPETMSLDVGLSMLAQVITKRTRVIAPRTHCGWRSLAESRGATLATYDHARQSCALVDTVAKEINQQLTDALETA